MLGFLFVTIALIGLFIGFCDCLNGCLDGFLGDSCDDLRTQTGVMLVIFVLLGSLRVHSFSLTILLSALFGILDGCLDGSCDGFGNFSSEGLYIDTSSFVDIFVVAITIIGLMFGLSGLLNGGSDSCLNGCLDG